MVPLLYLDSQHLSLASAEFRPQKREGVRPNLHVAKKSNDVGHNFTKQYRAEEKKDAVNCTKKKKGIRVVYMGKKKSLTFYDV